ncbi:MAG: hypothetical protein N2C14_11005, partial [Planctomycetales bacterium]
YAGPLDRLLLLLGLNCGFGVAEIASLQVDEVVFRTAHSPDHRELLQYESTNADSFIKRVRRKSNVYGEFILFPLTAAGLEWALKRRPTPSPDTIGRPLLLNSKGESFDKPTKTGNRNQQIPNYFGRLLKRIKNDGHDVSNLSFGKLRKTAGDRIRQLCSGEVMGVFLCHGNAVKTDDLADVYSDRPFGKVFTAIHRFEEYLAPVFEAAGPDPFRE